jgi:aldehyde dehydrogenase (NAD+)
MWLMWRCDVGRGTRAAHNRAQICYFIAENLMTRYDEFAQRLVEQTGVTLELAQKEVDASVQRLFHYAAYADKYGGRVKETTLYGLTAQINEPVGAIGIVCPDEQPLLSFISLIAPALVRANTVVIVPSEKHPLSATDLYQVLDTSDLPGGVINIVTGMFVFVVVVVVD